MCDSRSSASACATASSNYETFGYDLQGRMVSAAFADGGDTVSLAHDGLGRTTSTTVAMGGANRTVSYNGVLGDVTRITHPDGVYFTIAYD